MDHAITLRSLDPAQIFVHLGKNTGRQHPTLGHGSDVDTLGIGPAGLEVIVEHGAVFHLLLDDLGTHVLIAGLFCGEGEVVRVVFIPTTTGGAHLPGSDVV